MLYKHYRYILILKIILLIIGGYMLLHEWDVKDIQGGTLFIVDQQPGSAASRLDKIMEEKLPTPWAFASHFSGSFSIQVPWTYDTGYITRYMKQPIPIVYQSINNDIYTSNCQKKVILTDYLGWKVEKCSLGVHYNTMTAIILVAIGLLL